MNTNVIKLVSDGVRVIKHLEVEDTIMVEKKQIFADKFVCSLPVEQFAKLVKENKALNYYTDLTHIQRLATLSKQLQLSISYYLDQKILFPVVNGSANTTIYLVDSPWVLMILPKGHHFSSSLEEYGDGRVQDIWEVGIGHTKAKGIYGKTFEESTPEECIREVWDQCLESKVLDSGCFTESGVPMHRVQIIETNIWDTYNYNSETQSMSTWEQKFSNNTGTYRLRPNVKTEVSNLYVATAYTHHSGNIFHMEGAAEAGIQAAMELK